MNLFGVRILTALVILGPAACLILWGMKNRPCCCLKKKFCKPKDQEECCSQDQSCHKPSSSTNNTNHNSGNGCTDCHTKHESQEETHNK